MTTGTILYPLRSCLAAFFCFAALAAAASALYQVSVLLRYDEVQDLPEKHREGLTFVYPMLPCHALYAVEQ